ncbi:MAG: TonB-dependent receptor [Pseudomonadales bacterium]
MRFRKSILASTIGLIAAGVNAQDQLMLEEVVVTTQKRAESMQDIPVAVSAFTGDFVQEAGIKDIRDVAGMTPGLSIKSRGETEGSVFIRGIGSAAPGIGADPAVGIYIDGLYASRGTNATAAFFDVERVEVVKGPQGTLFGRNASAGAIAIHTNKPDLDESYGSVLVGVGDEGQQKYEFIYNAAVADNFGVRLGVKHDERDGLYENSINGDELNDRDHSNARLSFLYDAGSYRSHLSFEYIDMSNNAAFVAGPQAFDSEVALNDTPDDQTLESLRVNWTNTVDLSDELTFTSITGYYNHEVNVTPVDADLVDVFVASFEEPQNAEYLSQELRLNGSSDALDWFVGASYAKERLDFVNDLNYDESIVVPLLGPDLGLEDTVDGDACDGDIENFGLFGVPTCLTSVSETPQGDGVTESFAVYGDATWHVTDRLGLTFGVRYTEDHKRITYNNPATAGLLGALDGQIFGPITAGDAKAKDDWQSVDPRVAINYDVGDNTMIYFNAGKGYKSGGLNRQLDPGSGMVLPFDKEQNTAYEVGVKSQLWDGRAQLNVALFQNTYEDFQLEELINLVPQVDNVGDVDVQGLDLDFKVLISENLEVWGSFGYLDTEVDDDGARDGNETPQAPETSGSLAAKYFIPVADGELAVSATWEYSDSFFFDLANTLEQESYGVWNARIAWENDVWGVALLGDNLADEEYLAEQFLFLDVSSIRAPGRYVRLEGHFNF